MAICFRALGGRRHHGAAEAERRQSGGGGITDHQIGQSHHRAETGFESRDAGEPVRRWPRNGGAQVVDLTEAPGLIGDQFSL